MTSAPSENWDEDFDFHPPEPPKSGRSRKHSRTQNERSKSPPKRSAERTTPSRASRSPPAHSRVSTATNAAEDWDETPASSSSTSSSAASGTSALVLASWAEPGPSTPTRRTSKEENWDDDFEDRANSPPRVKAAVTTSWDSPSTRVKEHPLESWDEPKSPSKRSYKSPRKAVTTPKRSFSESSDSEGEFGFGKDDGEDRTVTARSKRGVARNYTAPQTSPPPPVPALPASFLGPGLFGYDNSSPAPFPRSPTTSVFTQPNRDPSVYNAYTYGSSSHLALRPTHSNASSALSNLPPSPPIHRERRRLRKKSRSGARGDVFELGSVNEPPSADEMDSAEDGMPPPPSPGGVHSGLPTPSSTPSGSALLSRIGSVKKWGVRKKRASTGPGEINTNRNVSGSSATSGRMDSDDVNLTPRPASSMSATSTTSPPPSTKGSNNSSNWFFRGSGGAGSPPSGQGKVELRHQGSLKRMNQEDSPSKYLMKRKSLAFQKRASEEMEPLQTTPRRPTSMQVPPLRQHQSYKSPPMAASLGRAAVAPRIGSASVDDLPRGGRRATDSVEDIGRSTTTSNEKQGSRSFMGSVRKLSFAGGKHKRGKSAAIVQAIIPRPSAHAPPTPVVEYQYHVGAAPLLPPIALQPPSPPRVNRETVCLTGSPGGLEPLLLPTSHSRESSAGSGSSRNGSPKPPVSPHSASLGRSAAIGMGPGGVPRRNSLGDLHHGSLGRVREGTVVDYYDPTKPEPSGKFGDLKIPARIHQAQMGLKRDLGMVKEFAANVEQLKALQFIYNELIVQVNAVIERHEPVCASSDRSVSPNLFKTPRRNRSNTNPGPPSKQQAQAQQAYKQLVTAFYTINSKYRISWECAELLIELGGGTPPSPPNSPPSTSVSAPVTLGSQSANITIPRNSSDGRKSRERAITLAGDEKPAFSSSVPSPIVSSPQKDMAWRASTGRHDLSSRQLMLLREMLTNPTDDGRRTPIHEEPGDPYQYHGGTVRSDWGTINRDWRWGDAMNSTVTLQSDESGHQVQSGKKRRSSKMGMSGLRDLLRSLKRGVSEAPPPLPTMRAHMSTVSLSTDSSLDGHGRRMGRSSTRRRTKPGAESLRTTAAYGESSLNQHKASPRRPSLASIFRLGQKSKNASSMSTTTTPPTSAPADAQPSISRRSGQGSSTDDHDHDFDEDWDRMDSNSDLDNVAHAAHAAAAAPDGFATVKGVRGRSPYLQFNDETQRPITPKRTASSSRSSLWGAGEGSPQAARATRLSNVEESGDDLRQLVGSRVSLTNSSSPKPSRKPSLKKQKATGGHQGSIRSAPPQSHLVGGGDTYTLPDPKLAMTPENIKPLLENAREVHARLQDCIEEIRLLLALHA